MDVEPHLQSALDRLLELGAKGIPVLSVTVEELARLERTQEQISSAELASVILRDPLMTLRVLNFLYSHRTRSQTKDITTIAHALMMLGMARFFREFGALPAIEARAGPAAIAQVRQASSRARLASLFARDWALVRHDVDAEEVMVAALVHDVIEPLAVCALPEGAPRMTAHELAELRAALFARLGLPGLLAELTPEGDSQQPRVLNVSIACALACCVEHGWNDACLDAELARVQRLLHISQAEVWDRVRKAALAAAREWRVYEVRPAAAFLPMYCPSPGVAEKAV
jgi:hypothetical protein